MRLTEFVGRIPGRIEADSSSFSDPLLTWYDGIFIRNIAPSFSPHDRSH